jgi:hypothetical protein
MPKRTRKAEGDGGSHRETSAEYRGVVAVLNDRWRVIDTLEPSPKRQWILQSLRSKEKCVWKGIAYTQKRSTLLRCIRERVLNEISPSALGIIERLPDVIEGGPP